MENFLQTIFGKIPCRPSMGYTIAHGWSLAKIWSNFKNYIIKKELAQTFLYNVIMYNIIHDIIQ